MSLRGRAALQRAKEQRSMPKRPPGTISVRGGAGLGDGLYVQSIARHLLRQGHTVEVCTFYPDIFLPLQQAHGPKFIVSRFRRFNIDRVAHYTGRKTLYETDQFEDCCHRAGIYEPVEFKIDWEVQNGKLVRQLRSHGKPVVLVQLPRRPMGRNDGFGDELLPDCRTIQRAVDALKGRAFIAQIGKGIPLFKLKGIDLDLSNRTTVRDLIDVASVADGFLGYCSFIAPLAESLSKPLLLVWSRRGVNSKNPFINAIRPCKIFHRDYSRAVMDDCSEEELQAAVEDLYSRTWKPEEVAA